MLGICKKSAFVTVCLFLVCTTVIYAASLSDDFNRPDDTIIGNGWIEGATGNDGPYGSYTLPDASISNNVVKFDRNGYGWGANSSISRPLSNADYVTVDISNPVDNALVVAHLGLDNGAGDGIYLNIYRTSATNVHLTVQKTLASYGGGDTWYTFSDTDLGDIDWATYKVFTNPSSSALYVSVVSDGTEIAHIDFAGWIQPLFTNAAVYTTWAENAYGTGFYTYADNFYAPPVIASDDFNRADGDIGNDWTQSATGNTYTPTKPARAIISGNQVLFDRNGDGDNAIVAIQHGVAPSGSVQADISLPNSNPFVTANFIAGDGGLNCIQCDLTRGGLADPTHVQLRVQKQIAGVWSDIGYWDVGNIGPSTVRITTDGVEQVSVEIASGGSIVFNGIFSQAFLPFTSAAAMCRWHNYPSRDPMYMDNFLAVPIDASDDFNRADGNVIGNGWIDGPSWNSYQSGTYPLAEISNGTLKLIRHQTDQGNSGAQLYRALDAALSVQADLDLTTAANQTWASLSAYSDALNGIHCMAAKLATEDYGYPAGNTVLRVQLYSAGNWSDLGYYDLGVVSDWFTCNISTDNSSTVTVSVKNAEGTRIFYQTYSLLQHLFSRAAVGAYWNDDTSLYPVYIDNFLMTNSASPISYTPVDIRGAKTADDNTNVSVDNAIVTGCFYGGTSTPVGFAIEDSSRISGMRVVWNALVQPGSIVKIEGQAATVDGERVLQPDTVTVRSTGNVIPGAIGVSNRDTGGAAFGKQDAVFNAPGVAATGPNNIGLLTKVFGKVTASHDTSSWDGYFYVDDGSGLNDGTGNAGIRCRPVAKIDGTPEYLPWPGDCVAVTGVMGVRQVDGVNVRHFWTTSVDWFLFAP